MKKAALSRRMDVSVWPRSLRLWSARARRAPPRGLRAACAGEPTLSWRRTCQTDLQAIAMCRPAL